uniref:CRISPR-associated helicase Cas3 n=1 Tax=Loigolactobacillus rennini TaxID=238013 RepID=A0A1K2I874_9LACO|nr:CRISPR-associated helicase Cas3 [Loigolactobacillus rennini]
MTYLAHISQDDGREQSLNSHLLNVRQLCEKWGADCQLTHVCGLAGWLHDVGKYNQDFQRYIKGISNAKRGSIDHSTAGAIYLAKYDGQVDHDAAQLLTELVGNAIMAHHNPKGILDFVGPNGVAPFSKRLAKLQDDPKYKQQYEQDWTPFFADFKQSDFTTYYQQAITEIQSLTTAKLIKDQTFYLRFVLSVLIDADHTDTADFEEGYAGDHQEDTATILAHYNAVDEAAVKQQIVENQQQRNPKTKRLNQLRQEMSDACYRAANDTAGIYSLSVPTGGGKTLSSLRFALRKAKTQNVQRIVYVVPYTTIIEQNADVIRKRLNGNKEDSHNILEYHSNISNEPNDKSDFYDPNYYYARDSWNAPIILTSQVAYLNALFGSGSKNIRHMHRLVHSVIIFDEVQTLPVKCIQLNNDALKWFTQQGTTSLLCTATQPALDQVQNGLTVKKEIVPDLEQAQEAFKRVEITPVLNQDEQLKVFTIPNLIAFIKNKLADNNSLLVILNTKAAVLAAYQALPEHEDLLKYHLSTAMCPKNRQDKFFAIKNQLKNKKQKIVVFATNLIEAGVDLSFSCVIRSCAGIDNIIQAAGRCNRNNEKTMGHTYLIQMDRDVEKIGGPLKFIQQAAHITKDLVHENLHHNLLSNQVIKQYFTRLYMARNSELPYPMPTLNGNKTLTLYPLVAFTKENGEEYRPSSKWLTGYIQKWRKFFPNRLTTAPNTVAKYFQVIDSETTDVIVQYDKDSEKLVSELLSEKSKFSDISQLLKQAQQYCVSVYGDLKNANSQLGQLYASGSIKYYPEQDIYVAEAGAYSEDYGLGKGKLDLLAY